MDATHKKILKAIILEIRHSLEGRYDAGGTWQPGDLERRLAAMGVRRDRKPLPMYEIPHLSALDKRAREVVDAYLSLRVEAGIDLSEAVAEFVRETAYSWANRLLALRCMEARELIDEVILQKPVYGGRSLEHHRLAQRRPESCSGEDDGLFAVLDQVFEERAGTLSLLFDPRAPGVALKPTPSALMRSVRLLSGTEQVNGQTSASDDVFKAPDALGWAYQYWNTEEKDRVFEKVRTQKGAKIQGADIIPATQLYTEPYMVKFLVQNSLGATWVGMQPDTQLMEGWEYFVRDADRAPVEKKPVQAITFLDPACGSGHFLIEAFDLFYAMYEEEGHLTEPEAICRSILEKNLFGIDIDERAVQIAAAALWMKAAEKAFEFGGAAKNLVATNIRLPKGKDHLEEFLKEHPEDKPIRPALEVIFEGLAHADELGSLLQIEEPVEREFKHLKETDDRARSHGTTQGDLFRPTAVQDQLPFGIESYDEWRKKTVAALKEHFAAEAESADLGQAFFGQSVGKGLVLFDLLSRRYDVVAANPPYMGSKHLNTHQKKYLQMRYPAGKRDLYAMFMIRSVALSKKTARIAMVTRHSWLFLKYFEMLRGNQENPNYGILYQSTIETLVHLGPHAFSEIGGEIVNTVLFTLLNTPPQHDSKFSAIRVVDAPSLEKKQSQLKRVLQGELEALRSFPEQLSFTKMPLSQIMYWLPKKFLNVFLTHLPLKYQATVREGLHTSNSYRFVRFAWECADSRGQQRWVKYAKGGGYSKWAGYDEFRCEWEFNGARIFATGNAIIPSQGRYFENGFTYSKVGGAAFSVRRLENSIFSDAGQAIFPKDGMFIPAFLNTRIASYFLRLLSPTMDFNKGYVELCPIPSSPHNYEELAGLMIANKVQILSSIPTENSFDVWGLCKGVGIYHVVDQTIKTTNELIAFLLMQESRNEIVCCNSLGLEDEDVKLYTNDVGTPAGLHPAINGYDAPPEIPNISGKRVEAETLHVMEPFYSKMVLKNENLDYLRSRLKQLYTLELNDLTYGKAGRVYPINHEETDNSHPMCPIPSESFLEELSQYLCIHPFSVYWLLKEGIENEGWRCPREDHRIAADRFTVIILQLLGHRWPKQIETNEPIPDWADQDGIIPLTDVTNEQTLLNRVRDRISAEFEGGDVTSIEREFAEIMGKPLDQWLEVEFFKHHVKQFKKRPIAWQIQSGKYARNNKPAFACLVYYHKLDGDLLPKIRTHYIGPLRQRCETELRGIEALPLDARSDRQEKRRIELETQIEELKDFDSKLKDLTESAFGPRRMIPHLRQNALEDSMLCLKTRWLKKLSGIMQQYPLKDWITLAEQAEVHENLPEWIMEPVYNLHYFCSKVGAHTPKEKTFKDDPGAGELAEIICSRAENMVKGSLRLVCTSWWKNLDDAVFTPLRKRIRDLQEELKLLKEKEAVEGKENPQLISDFEMRIESIKMEMKPLRKALADKTEKAKRIRDEIENWSNTDALTWEPWLATQHMYDAISGIDSQHNPPGSIQDFIRQESAYLPDIDDGVRVNIVPLQKAGVLAGDVLAKKDLDKAISDRAEWRADERRWVREGKLPQPGWWPTAIQDKP